MPFGSLEAFTVLLAASALVASVTVGIASWPAQALCTSGPQNSSSHGLLVGLVTPPSISSQVICSFVYKLLFNLRLALHTSAPWTDACRGTAAGACHIHLRLCRYSPPSRFGTVQGIFSTVWSPGFASSRAQLHLYSLMYIAEALIIVSTPLSVAGMAAACSHHFSAAPLLCN